MPGTSHRWRTGDFIDSLNLFAHEFIHSWTAHLSYYTSRGTRGRLTGDSCNCHWRPELHTPTAFPFPRHEREVQSVMGAGGGRFWRDNGDGTFTAVGKQRRFGDRHGLISTRWALRTPMKYLTCLYCVTWNQLPETTRRGGAGSIGERITETRRSFQSSRSSPPKAHGNPAPQNRKRTLTRVSSICWSPERVPPLSLLDLHAEYRDKVQEHWFHITGGRSLITTNVDGMADATPGEPPVRLLPERGRRHLRLGV